MVIWQLKHGEQSIDGLTTRETQGFWSSSLVTDIAANAIESGQPQGQRVICAQTTHFWRAQTNPEPKNKTIEP